MPAFQPLLPFLRPFAAPRASTCRQFLSFSTTSRLCIDQPSKPVDATKVPPPTETASPAAPEAPSTPAEASRAASLAAAEALTDGDSAQPVAPKPMLPSDHTETPSSAPEASTTAPEVSIKAAVTFPTTSGTSPKGMPKKSIYQSSKPKDKESGPITLSLPPARYHVARSRSKNYPVYTDFKRGGNLHLTMVQKITGEASALRDELRIFLNKKERDVNVNGVTGHVVVKGHHREEIVKYLQARGM